MRIREASGEHRRRGPSGRGVALLRLALLPIFFAGQWLVDDPRHHDARFEYILAAATVYALVALALTWAPRRFQGPRWLYVAIDLGFIAALTYVSGGAHSEARYAFFVMPIGLAVLLRPGHAALAAVASVAAFLGVALPHASGATDVDYALVQAAYVAWAGLTAVGVSLALELRSERITRLAAQRGRLVAQALDAEDRERRTLAEALHDEAIQNLLAARQDLEEAELGDRASVARAHASLELTVAQLRDAVFELHPYVLEHAGLAAALDSVAKRQSRRGGYSCKVEVSDAASGVHDQVLFSLARELLANVTRHAAASRVSVRVTLDGDDVLLEIADDGRGFSAQQRTNALREGHIGLASSSERVEALGGRFEVDSAPARGTRVRASIPIHLRAAA